MTAAPEVEFNDVRLTEAQSAKAAGIALDTFREMVNEGRGHWTLWSEGTQRWVHSLKAGHR